jgi:hypothetical protein
MQIAYTLTFPDYLEAQRVHASRSTRAQIFRFLNWWFFPVLGLVLVVTSLILWREGSALITVSLVLLYGLFLVSYRYLLQGRVRKVYRETRRGTGATLLDIDDDHFFCEWPDFAKTSIAWQAVKKFRENEKVILVYVAPAIFLILPKRSLSPEQYGQLVFLLNRKVASSA